MLTDVEIKSILDSLGKELGSCAYKGTTLQYGYSVYIEVRSEADGTVRAWVRRNGRQLEASIASTAGVTVPQILDLVKTLLHEHQEAEAEKVVNKPRPIGWKPIDFPATLKHYVLLRGDSGYDHDFIQNGRWCEHKEDFVDVTGERLKDAGFIPSMWREEL